ncbi:MAG: hypothetical protein V1779_07195 [bacterium]
MKRETAKRESKKTEVRRQKDGMTERRKDRKTEGKNIPEGLNFGRKAKQEWYFSRR